MRYATLFSKILHVSFVGTISLDETLLNLITCEGQIYNLRKRQKDSDPTDICDFLFFLPKKIEHCYCYFYWNFVMCHYSVTSWIQCYYNCSCCHQDRRSLNWMKVMPMMMTCAYSEVLIDADKVVRYCCCCCR